MAPALSEPEAASAAFSSVPADFGSSA
jgi:hypothetical protein